MLLTQSGMRSGAGWEGEPQGSGLKKGWRAERWADGFPGGAWEAPGWGACEAAGRAGRGQSRALLKAGSGGPSWEGLT